MRYISLSIVAFLVYTNLNLFTYFVTGVTTLLDLPARTNLNDSIVNSFNFFWTSFTYLPTFFFGLLILFLTLYTSYYQIQVVLIGTFGYLLYNFEVVDFLALNTHWYSRDGSLSGINLLLANNLNKYHPLIFYTSVFFLTPILLTLPLTYLNQSLFVLNSTLTSFTHYTLSTLVVNIFALFLGSWWALQEGTWGGWWNWDASEVLGLMVSLVSLQNIHTQARVNNLTQLLERFVMLVLVFVFSYFFIQLNFDLVSHNFGSKFFFFFNNNLFFLELLGSLSIALGLTASILYANRNGIITLLPSGLVSDAYSIRWLGVISLYVLMASVLLSSFLPLMNYFIWSYFSVNSFNFYVHLPLLTIPIFILFTLSFISYEYIGPGLVLVFFLGTYECAVFTLLGLTSIRHSLVSLIHFSLSILIAVNLSSYLVNFVYWYPTMFFEEIPFTNYCSYIKQDVLVCDMFFIDKLTLYQVSTEYWNTSAWNTFYHTNACNLNAFVLKYDVGTYFNYYLLSDEWLSPALYIETNYLNNLLEVLISLTLITCLHTLFKETWVKY